MTARRRKETFVKRVIIIGGGYAGTMLARSLDPVAEVVLVEPKAAFIHNVAAIRAIVDPSLLDRLILPYDRLLKRGRVVHDRAVAIEDGAVRLATNGSISGDIVVIATGSSYAHPFKASDDVSAFRSASLDANEKLRAARSVAIVGAGAVGTELAGEIAAGMPAKKITLISPAPTLFPDFPPALGRRLQLDLQSMGVMLRLGAKAERLQGADRPFQGPVALTAGAAVAADLVFPTMGASPVNELARDLPGGELDPIGRVRVDPWLRPAGRTNMFALGDVAATGDLMTIVAITRQAPWLAKSIKAVVAGQRVEFLAPVCALAFAANSRSARSEARRKRASAHEARPHGWRVPDLVDQGQDPFHPALPQGVRDQIARQ